MASFGDSAQWFAAYERKTRQGAGGSIRNKAALGLSLFNAVNGMGVNPQAVAKAQKVASTVQKAKGFIHKKVAAKVGYEVVRHAGGDSILTHVSLTNDGGMEDLSKDGTLSHVLPDTDEWEEILLESTAKGAPWTDPNFPPTNSSLFRDHAGAGPLPDWAPKVHHWARVGDIFHRTRVIRFTFTEDSKAPECYGYASHAEPSPKLEAAKDANLHRKAAHLAVRAAINLVKAGFDAARFGPSPSTEEGQAAMATLVRLGGPMGANLADGNDGLFGIIHRALMPLVFMKVDENETFVVKREAKEGYVPMLTVQVTLQAGPSGGQLHLFEGGANAADVCQGALGSCYFLGALSVMGCNPQSLLSLFPDVSPGAYGDDGGGGGANPLRTGEQEKQPQRYNEQGVYAVRMWRGGAWRVVVVDDWLPVDEFDAPVMAQPPHGTCECWALIAEKAYAKLNGSYEAIEGGHENIALQDLTGGVALSIDLGSKFDVTKWRNGGGLEPLAKAGVLESYVRDRLAEGSGLGVTKSSTAATVGRCEKIVPAHAYGILALGAFEGETLVQVRNPWGQGKEWDGAFGDHDPIWSTLSGAEKERLGYTDAEDGTWWMPFEALVTEFDELTVCRNMVGRFQAHSVIGRWQGLTAAGSVNPHLAPQFHLHVEKDCTVVVEVRQPSCRESKTRAYEAVAPVVAAKADRKGNVFLEPRVGKSVYHHGRSSVLEAEIKAADGPFSISPVAITEGFEGLFYLYVYTSEASRLVACRDDDVPVDAVTGEVLRHPILCFERKDGTSAYVLKKNKTRYLLSSADKCGHCNEPVGIAVEGKYEGSFYPTEVHGKIHAECYDAYKVAQAPKCFLCAGPVTAIAGRFDGSSYTIEGKGKLHAECYAAFKESTAPRCFLCAGPVMMIAGRFDGSSYTIEGKGKLHSECHGAYKLSTAEACGFCKGPVGIEIPGKYDGTFYRTDDDGKIHAECYDDYRVSKAPLCFWCNAAITNAGGHYSGKSYIIDGKGKLHSECYASFKGAN